MIRKSDTTGSDFSIYTISPKKVALAVAFSGASGLIYEILATTNFSFFITNNTYSLSAVLSIFLFGLAIGGYLISRIITTLSRYTRIVILVALQISTGIYVLLILSNLNLLPQLIRSIPALVPGSTNISEILKIGIAGNILLLIPNIMLGASLPILYALGINSVDETGEKIASFYSLDLLGAIVGSTVIGFIIIPMFGLKAGFAFGGLLNLATAILMVSVLTTRHHRFIALTLVAAYLVCLLPNHILDTYQFTRLVNKQGDIFTVYNKNIVYEANSNFGLIQVMNENQQNALYINHKLQCAKSLSMQKALSQLALQNTAYKYPRVLVIGYGCGYTVHYLLQNERIKILDVVEINAKIPRLERYFFKDQISPLEDKRLHLTIRDGFAYLENTQDTYDLIIIDIEDPATIHSSPLYTVEGFALARSRLAQGGLLTLNGGGDKHEYVKILYDSLRAVYKYVRYTKRDNLFFFASNREFATSELTEEEQRLQEKIQQSPKVLNTLNNQVLKYQFE